MEKMNFPSHANKAVISWIWRTFMEAVKQDDEYMEKYVWEERVVFS